MLSEASFLFLAITAFAVFFVGLAKAGFGGMIGSLAMPLVASVSDMTTAISVLLPTYVVMDVAVAVMYRKTVRWDVLWPMAIAGLIGAALGAVAFRALDGSILRIGLGVVSIWSALRFAWGQRRGSVPLATLTNTRNWPRISGLCGASGFLSFFLMGEAPVQIYLSRFRLDPKLYVSVLVWFFAVVNVSKMPIVLGMGLVTRDTLIMSALFLPVMPFGLLLGRLIINRIPKEPFYVLIHVLLFGLGLYLIISGLAALS